MLWRVKKKHTATNVYRVQLYTDGSKRSKGEPGKPRMARSKIIRNTAATLLTDDTWITLRSMAAILQVSLATTHRIVKEELDFLEFVHNGFLRF